MKPFLGIDITENRKNQQSNGSEFRIAEPSPTLVQAFHASTDKTRELLHSSRLPAIIGFVQWLCGTFSALFAIALLRALAGGGISPKEAYENAPRLFWAAVCCLLVWLILKVLRRKREQDVLSKDESQTAFSSLFSVWDAIFAELSVPDNAQEIDILMFFYKTKTGHIKVCDRAGIRAPYENHWFKIYKDTENLYLANLEGKYALPLSSLRGIRTVNKRIRVCSWNKDDAPTKGKYKQYKLSLDGYGCIRCKPYHILEFFHNGKTWGIWFPCYELPVWETMTGMKAQ